MRYRLAVLMACIVLVASATGVAAASKSGTETAGGVTQYQWVYYNTQTCQGSAHYQIYLFEFRFYRIDRNRTAKYQAAVGGEGENCSRAYDRWSGGPPSPTTWYYPCWGPCGNSSSPLWSRTQSYSFSGKPYLRGNNNFGFWVGSWVDSRALDLQGSAFATQCIELSVSASGDIC